MNIPKLRAVATALAASAALAVATAGPVLAAATLTVSVAGGNPAFTGTATIAVMKDVKTGVMVTCKNPAGGATSTVSADIATANYPKATPPVDIGTSTNQMLDNCKGPAGDLTITPVGEPYTISVISTTNLSQTDLQISPVDVNVSGTACAFSVSGDLPGFYNNTHHTLTLRPTLPVPPVVVVPPLTVTAVTGCLGFFNKGDHVTLTATYTIAPATLTVISTTP